MASLDSSNILVFDGGEISSKVTCPVKGSKVRCISGGKFHYNHLGTVDNVLLPGMSFLCEFPTPHGVAFVRLERNELEVVENIQTAVSQEHLYRRYARIRLDTLVEALQLICGAAGIGDSIISITNEVKKMAQLAFSPEEAQKFLADHGFPNQS